jgi:hypothetical protein
MPKWVLYFISNMRHCSLTIFQDSFVAKQDPDQAFVEEAFVNWEPGLTDGPTSFRFAVVDYNSDTGKLAAPAEWDEPLQKFVCNGKVLDKTSASLFQFRQVSLWELLQRALAFFSKTATVHAGRSRGRSKCGGDSRHVNLYCKVVAPHHWKAAVLRVFTRPGQEQMCLVSITTSLLKCPGIDLRFW